MDYYGIKRVRGKGYENKNVIRRKKGGSRGRFFLFAALFGAVVYAAASAFFHSVTLPSTITAFSILF